jgi:hypothetical protein
MTPKDRQSGHLKHRLLGLQLPTPPVAIIAGLLIVISGTFSYASNSNETTDRTNLNSSHSLGAMPKDGLGAASSPTTSGEFLKPSPIAGPAPGITGTQVSPPAHDAFVKVCGTSLCVNGEPYVIHGATAYGTYDDPPVEVALAEAAKLNTLELVEFDTHHHVLADTMTEPTWARVDKFIAAAKARGLHVVLNLSEYGQSLQAAGQIPTTVDWGPYLSFIANRVNTVTGAQYRNDPTISMVELFGEICYPGEEGSTCPAGTSGSASDMTSFFHRSETEWSALAPQILVSSGGFSHLSRNTSIPWQAIVSDPADAVCSMEINSPNDVMNTVAFTNYCKSLGKPWFLAAWSSCYNKPSYSFHMPTDATMASHADDMYAIARGDSLAAYPSIGANFWNLRDEGAVAGTCSIGPSFPLTWDAVRSNAP